MNPILWQISRHCNSPRAGIIDSLSKGQAVKEQLGFATVGRDQFQEAWLEEACCRSWARRQRRGCTANPCGRDLGDTVPEPKRAAATPWFSVLPLSVTATAATQVQVQRNGRKHLSSGHTSTSSLGRGGGWQRSQYHAPLSGPGTQLRNVSQPPLR